MQEKRTKRAGRAIIASLSLGVVALSACSTPGENTLSPASSSSVPAHSSTANDSNEEGNKAGSSPSPASSSTPSSSTSSNSSLSGSSPSAATAAPNTLLSKEELRQQAARLIAVGVSDFDDAKKAIDAGVRHIFITSGTDLSILNGRGAANRSLAELQRLTNNELTVSVDEEGGSVQRLSSIIGSLPSGRELGTTSTPDQVRAMMAEHAKKMADLGITMDFAPDVDLDSGGTTTSNAIGDRAFSADPEIVTAYGRAVIEGFQSAGIVPVIKHFPGHGHASGDSHTGSVSTPPLKELYDKDLRPFAELSQIPGVAVMMGHLSVPDLGEQAASINPAAYDLLRSGQYPGASPFQGMVITDDLTGMNAIAATHSGAEAAVLALEAGADMVLTTVTGDALDIRDAIVDAVESGKISQERLLASVERVRVL